MALALGAIWFAGFDTYKKGMSALRFGRLAAHAGIDESQGNLLPEDKLAAIKGLQRLRGATAMIGDGVNDAPAFAQAASASRWAVQALTRRWNPPTWSS